MIVWPHRHKSVNCASLYIVCYATLSYNPARQRSQLACNRTMSNAEEVLAAAMSGRQIDGTRMHESFPEPELILEAHEEAARLMDATRQSALHLRNALGVVVVMMSLFA